MTRVRTISLAICAYFVLRVLEHLPERPSVSLRRSFILSCGHRDGGFVEVVVVPKAR